MTAALFAQGEVEPYAGDKQDETEGNYGDQRFHTRSFVLTRYRR